MKKIFIPALIVILSGCATKLYIPDQSNVNKQMTATVEEMMQGRDIYGSKCGACHKLPKPESRNMMEWSAVMEKMGPKAKLDKGQVDLVLKYLANHNTK